MSLARPEEEQQATATHLRGDEQRREELPEESQVFTLRKRPWGVKIHSWKERFSKARLIYIQPRDATSQKTVEEGSALLGVQEETAQRLRRAELRVSDPQPLQEESWRPKRRTGDNRCLPSPGGAPLRGKSSGKLGGGPADGESAQRADPRTRASGSCWPRSSSTPSSPRGAFMFLLLHPQPPGARRGQGSPWVTRPPPHPGEGEGPALRTQGPAVTCRRDSAHCSRSDTHDQDTTSACVSLFQVGHNISLCFSCFK